MAASISDIRLLLRVKSLPKSSESRRVFITGGTGYIGSNLIPVLTERDHRVRVLVRPDGYIAHIGSEHFTEYAGEPVAKIPCPMPQGERS